MLNYYFCLRWELSPISSASSSNGGESAPGVSAAEKSVSAGID